MLLLLYCHIFQVGVNEKQILLLSHSWASLLKICKPFMRVFLCEYDIYTSLSNELKLMEITSGHSRTCNPMGNVPFMNQSGSNVVLFPLIDILHAWVGASKCLVFILVHSLQLFLMNQGVIETL